MNEKYLVTYKQAKALKRIGYDWIHWFGMEASLYDKNGQHTMYTNYGVMGSGMSDGYISAPMKRQVFDWFEEEFGYYCEVAFYTNFASESYHYDMWEYMITKDIFYNNIYEDITYPTRVEAESACIDALIKIIKNNKK